jgi:hypothetical protein
MSEMLLLNSQGNAARISVFHWKAGLLAAATRGGYPFDICDIYERGALPAKEATALAIAIENAFADTTDYNGVIDVLENGPVEIAPLIVEVEHAS